MPTTLTIGTGEITSDMQPYLDAVEKEKESNMSEVKGGFKVPPPEELVIPRTIHYLTSSGDDSRLAYHVKRLLRRGFFNCDEPSKILLQYLNDQCPEGRDRALKWLGYKPSTEWRIHTFNAQVLHDMLKKKPDLELRFEKNGTNIAASIKAIIRNCPTPYRHQVNFSLWIEEDV